MGTCDRRDEYSSFVVGPEIASRVQPLPCCHSNTAMRCVEVSCGRFHFERHAWTSVTLVKCSTTGLTLVGVPCSSTSNSYIAFEEPVVAPLDMLSGEADYSGFAATAGTVYQSEITSLGSSLSVSRMNIVKACFLPLKNVESSSSHSIAACEGNTAQSPFEP